MFSFDSLGHINVVVTDLEEATRFYQELFGASIEQTFPHFKNVGFARSAGFLDVPESVDVSIRFLKFSFKRSEDLFLELFVFHYPPGRQEIMPRKTNDVGGPRHVCLRVTNIDEVLAHVKSIAGVHLINESPEYRPYFISPIKPRAIELPDADQDTAEAKEAICEIVKGIRFFYAIDRYGIEWEFEEGHADIGSA
jgi:catechol 2,3-dioxygenase-like lactoylglutathione lyase family enzyme